MFTSYLFLATAAYAAPIFTEGFLASRAVTQADGELAQGANFFFKSLTIESDCSPGQVACIGNNFAICSGEANWEVQLCFNQGTACFATPKQGDGEGINLQCMAEDDAAALIAATGAEGGVSVDRGITEIPSDVGTDPEPTDTEDPEPTETESAPEESASCTFDAPPEVIPTFEATLGNPFPSDIATQTGSDAPAATEEPVCTPPTDDDEPIEEEPIEEEPVEEEPVEEEPVDEEPSEDEEAPTVTLTLVLIPNPTATGEFLTSTLNGDAAPTATVPTEGEPAEEEPTETTPEESIPTDVYDYPEAPVNAPEEPASSSGAVEAPPSTTLTIAPPRPTSTNDINVIGVGVIPAKRSMIKKVRRN